MNSFFQGYIEQTYDTVGQLLETCKIAQKRRHIYLFGCGGIGRLTLDTLQRNGVEPYAFCSNDPAEVGTMVNGLPVVSFGEMCLDQSRFIILSTLKTQYIQQMREQLHAEGIFEYHFAFGLSLSDRRKTDIGDFSVNYDLLEQTFHRLDDDLSKKVLCAAISTKINNTLIVDEKLISKQPFFLDNVISFDSGEVYFDVGAFIGDNALRFLKRVPDAKVFSFEPDPLNFACALDRTKHEPAITMLHCGCGEKNETLRFVSRNAPNTALVSQAQSINENETTFSCEVIRLDDYRQYHPTFISMDIEGAELSALKGAEEIIKQTKPKLAVAIYHNAKDFWEIPQYILNLRPDYHFYARTALMGGEGCIGYFL